MSQKHVVQDAEGAFVVVGDIHLSDKAPSSRNDTYATEILAKLEWIVAFANGGTGAYEDAEADSAYEAHASAGLSGPVPIVLAGDVFHIKTPSRTSHELVQAAHEILREAVKGVWIVPGNHDLRHDRLESLDGQPLGALCRMEGVHLLMGADPKLDEAANVAVFGIPYLSEFDGGAWEEAIEPWVRQIPYPGSAWESGMPPDVVVTHAPLFPIGSEPNKFAYVPAQEWASLMTGCGVGTTYYGHIHDPEDAYDVGMHTFVNYGAISRGSLHEKTVNRKPAIGVYRRIPSDLYNTGFGKVEIPFGEGAVVKPPEAVYKFAEAGQAKVSKVSADAFNAALGSVTLGSLSTEEVIAAIAAGNPAKPVMEMVTECLEVAQS